MKKIALAFLLFVLIVPASPAQTIVREKYSAIQIDRLAISSDVEFPADYLLTLQEEIVKQMQESKLFQEVLRPGEMPSQSGAQVLRLTGTVTKFKAGSRAQRYIVGFGAGSTEVFAHLVYSDGASGAMVITDDIRGLLAAGFIGGESLNVTRDFARKVVTSAKVIVGKKLGDTVAASDPSAAGEKIDGPPAERKTLKFSSHDFPGVQARLNEEGKAGFRLVDFALTGTDSADMVLEKQSPDATFEYKVLHTRLPGTMQKEMNAAANDGYRLKPQTVGQFGGVMTTILERGSTPRQCRYNYRVHQTVRVSSAAKDTEKDQSEGYVLSGATHQSNVHLVVLEKEVKTEVKPGVESAD